MKKSKAKIILENLTSNQILKHKREKDFYIEYDGSGYVIYRNGKVIAIYDRIEFAETIVKHHDTRNWEIIESPFKYGFQRIVIPSAYREGLSNDDISDEFISDCLQRLRSLGENILNGQIEMIDILSNGDIEVFIEDVHSTC